MNDDRLGHRRGAWLSQPLVRVDRPIVPNGKESL